MASTTACLMVGGSAGFSPGMAASDLLLFSEGPHPSWFLYRLGPTPSQDGGFGVNGEAPIQSGMEWIVSPDRELEDGLLMLYYYVMRHPPVTAVFDPALRGNPALLIEVDTLLDYAVRMRLDAACQKARVHLKVVFTIMHDSLLASAAQRILGYTGLEVEICPMAYRRFFDPSTGSVRAAGSMQTESADPEVSRGELE